MHADDAEAPGDAALTVRTGHLRSGVPVIHVDGRLEQRTAPELRRLVDAQIGVAPWAIVLDLSGVSALEPAAVPALIGVADRAGDIDIGLYLVSPADAISHVLASADVLDLFEIHPTINAAVRALILDDNATRPHAFGTPRAQRRSLSSGRRRSPGPYFRRGPADRSGVRRPVTGPPSEPDRLDTTATPGTSVPAAPGPPPPVTVPTPDLMRVWPAVPDSLRPVRVAFAEWLGSLQWPAGDADDLILAVHEAVSNVIDHAYPATRSGPVHLHSWCDTGPTPASRRVTIVISDRGDWGRDHRTIDAAGRRGHGFVIMSGCTAEMHIQRGDSGTTIILISNDVPVR